MSCSLSAIAELLVMLSMENLVRYELQRTAIYRSLVTKHEVNGINQLFVTTFITGLYVVTNNLRNTKNEHKLITSSSSAPESFPSIIY